MKRELILILGGARSGKSALAQRIAEERWARPLFLATAEVGDAEMAERVRRHRQARGRRWRCVEEPLDVARVITRPPSRADGVLLDCVTIWLSNVMLKEGERAVARRQTELLKALRGRRTAVTLVSNEVGLGIVPEHELGRRFRDHAGRLNQALAAEADTVIFVAAGLTIALKGAL